MPKEEKLKSLETAMDKSKRDDGTEFYHFTSTAPESLRGVFVEHFAGGDVFYDIFDTACSMLVDIYNDESQETDGCEFIEEAIEERATDSASVYTSVRLEYLDSENQEEISEDVQGLEVSIADACGYWYDRQVEQAAMIINQWLNA